MNGIIIVDKPAGWTSHDVVAKLRGLLKTRRIGHGGTLDPMATGVLPVFIGRATLAVEFIEAADKEYIAGIRVGLVTDTQDITGSIISEKAAQVDAAELAAIIPRFLGAQKQIPPMYSAIKLDGKKLVDLARRGITVHREARDIFISEIELQSGESNEFLLRVVCSKGTYIRTLCHDIGQALGCGAVMTSLRRTRVGSFAIDKAYTLETIQNAVSTNEIERIIAPTDSIFASHKAAILNETNTQKCRNGAPCRDDSLPDGMYRFYGPDNEFLALGKIEKGEIEIIKRFFIL